MQKKVRIFSIIVFLIIVCIYFINILLGLQLTFKIQKIVVLIMILILGINIVIYICKFIKERKVLNIIISLQIELALVIAFTLILKNMNVNIYKVEKGNNSYFMKVNVNDNSKEYYLLKNSLFITNKYAIKEYLSDTSLSYEENIPTRIEYNKKLLPDEINKKIVSSKKKIISSNKLDNDNERIIKYIKNINEYKYFCDEYEIDCNYNEAYFQTSDLICISYIPFKEVIPFIALGEDNNYYVYVKEEGKDENDSISFAFIEINEKNNVNSVKILNYDENMKNKKQD